MTIPSSVAPAAHSTTPPLDPAAARRRQRQPREREGGEEEHEEPRLLRSGGVLARGRIRRVWRERYLELYDNAIVKYYEDVDCAAAAAAFASSSPLPWLSAPSSSPPPLCGASTTAATATAGPSRSGLKNAKYQSRDGMSEAAATTTVGHQQGPLKNTVSDPGHESSPQRCSDVVTAPQARETGEAIVGPGDDDDSAGAEVAALTATTLAVTPLEEEEEENEPSPSLDGAGVTDASQTCAIGEDTTGTTVVGSTPSLEKGWYSISKQNRDEANPPVSNCEPMRRDCETMRGEASACGNDDCGLKTQTAALTTEVRDRAADVNGKDDQDEDDIGDDDRDVGASGDAGEDDNRSWSSTHPPRPLRAILVVLRARLLDPTGRDANAGKLPAGRSFGFVLHGRLEYHFGGDFRAVAAAGGLAKASAPGSGRPFVCAVRTMSEARGWVDALQRVAVAPYVDSDFVRYRSASSTVVPRSVQFAGATAAALQDHLLDDDEDSVLDPLALSDCLLDPIASSAALCARYGRRRKSATTAQRGGRSSTMSGASRADSKQSVIVAADAPRCSSGEVEEGGGSMTQGEQFSETDSHFGSNRRPQREFRGNNSIASDPRESCWGGFDMDASRFFGKICCRDSKGEVARVHTAISSITSFVFLVVFVHNRSLVISFRLDVLCLVVMLAFIVGRESSKKVSSNVDNGATQQGFQSSSSDTGTRSPSAQLLEDKDGKLGTTTAASPTLYSDSDEAVGEVADDQSTVAEEEDSAAEVGEPVLASPLPQWSASGAVKTSCWSEPASNIFKVRGESYFQDRVKVKSAQAPFPCRGVDVWLTDEPRRHIARHPSVLGGRLAEEDMFVVNFLLPFCNFVAYFAIPPSHELPDNIAKVWDKFRAGDQQFRDARLKLLPLVIDGPWIVKTVVGPGNAPALLGKVVPLQYYFTEPTEAKKGVFEVDIIIAASKIANGILNVVKGHTRNLTIGFAFIIEAAEESELPETVLCSFQMHALHLSQCPKLPPSNLDSLR